MKKIKTQIMKNLEIKNNYTKIGGWLYLLCFLMIFVSPIRSVLLVYTEFKETSPYFKSFKGLETYVYLECLSAVFLMTISIWAGISLVLIKPHAVKLTKLYLFLILINGVFFQNILPYFAGLEEDFIKGMEYQMKVNTTSSILIFGIWFTYLSVSERVKQTYQNSENSNLKQGKNKIDLNKIRLLVDKAKNLYATKINPKINNLSSDEIIITSIILATLIALFFGCIFGETNHFDYYGNRVNGDEYMYKEFHFNYLLGTTSFIIFGGIIYLYLNRKNNKNEQ